MPTCSIKTEVRHVRQPNIRRSACQTALYIAIHPTHKTEKTAGVRFKSDTGGRKLTENDTKNDSVHKIPAVKGFEPDRLPVLRRHFFPQVFSQPDQLFVAGML